MSEPSFMEKLTMMMIEESYPTEIKRRDELSDKEKKSVLSSKEKWELEILDKKLLSEHSRCKRHYQVNWNFMSQEIKETHKTKVDTWWEAGKSINNQEKRS